MIDNTIHTTSKANHIISIKEIPNPAAKIDIHPKANNPNTPNTAQMIDNIHKIVHNVGLVVFAIF
jgi:hypothetical protein